MVHFGADGPGDAAFTFDGHALEKNVEGNWQYTDPDGLYTITVVQTGTDANEFRYSYTLEYDSTKVKEGFGGDLKVVATDGDLDTATDTVHIAVTNTAPEAADISMTSTRPWPEKASSPHRRARCSGTASLRWAVL